MMLVFSPVFFATLGLGLDSSSGGGISKQLVTDILIILGAGLAILTVLIYWAKYIRKKTRRRKGHHTERYKVFGQTQTKAATPSDEEEEEGSNSERRRYKYRYRRRGHRTRNPTLSETGGLPPSRPPASQDNAPLE
jgi:hypothetical protein